MDLTPLLSDIPALLEEYRTLLRSRTIVACLSDMKWLGAFICITPITEHIVGAATTETEGEAFVREHHPDFLIVSEVLEEGSGLSLVKTAEQLNPEIRTILVIEDSSEALIDEAVAVGCDGICFRSEPFTPVFRIVARGGVYYPRDVASTLRRQQPALQPQVHADDLTERETETLSRLILGYSNKQIAESLFLSPETVKSHVASIVSKLNARDRTHAAVLGVVSGIVSVEEALMAQGEVMGVA